MLIFKHVQVYTKAEHIHTHSIGKRNWEKKDPFPLMCFSLWVLPLKTHCNIHWCVQTNCSWQNLICFFSYISHHWNIICTHALHWLSHFEELLTTAIHLQSKSLFAQMKNGIVDYRNFRKECILASRNHEEIWKIHCIGWKISPGLLC